MTGYEIPQIRNSQVTKFRMDEIPKLQYKISKLQNSTDHSGLFPDF